jgi:hypothetical protein
MSDLAAFAIHDKVFLPKQLLKFSLNKFAKMAFREACGLSSKYILFFGSSYPKPLNFLLWR